jgi:hypothetical protein
MTPDAVPDAFSLVLLVLTIAAILAWRTTSLPLMLGGACVGTASRFNPLKKLIEFV